MMEKHELDLLSVATIRSLCIDIINKAKSGHPGMALGSAPIMYTLYTRHLNASPKNPEYFNRDRLIYSSGHASALIYTMLHLGGYELSMDDLKSFRQLNSLTPGHPEYHHTKGIDATSGPLGQGIAQAVGVALAEEAVRAQYVEGERLCSHYTYCLCGDGCLEEGISQEAISFAGHQKLNKLILIYDSNNVTLDGGLPLSNSEDTKLRFKAAHWNVLEVKDGNDIDAIDKAIKKAKKSLDMPTLIIVNTVIGYGSANEGTSKVHGSPLGEEDGANAKKRYGFNYPPFTVPEEVREHFEKTFIKRGLKEERRYNRELRRYKVDHPEEFTKFMHALRNDYKVNLNVDFSTHDNEASRNSSGKALNELYHLIPNLMGGSADVAGSVMTKIKDATNFEPGNRSGRNINFGIREFLMASIQNGMLLHGGVQSYIGSFLVFSDYMKSAIRMSALSNLGAIYLFSHDSIALGEDGPTHQPIEHLAMLRSIPNHVVIRPCDARETYAAWEIALKEHNRPVSLILSRQNLPLLSSNYDLVKKGAYVISEAKGTIDAIIIATGSEVKLALDAANELAFIGKNIRVVSMPSMELFDEQDETYKEKVLGKDKSKVFAVEMLSTFGWYKYADTVMGIDRFGLSAPAKDAINELNFTSSALVKLIRSKIG